MRTDSLAKDLLERFSDVKVVRGNMSLVLSKKFPDGAKVVMQISPEGEVLSVFYSHLSDQAILFTESVKEYLWRRRKVGV